MTLEWLTPALLALLLLVTAWLALRRPDTRPWQRFSDQLHELLRAETQRVERELRDEISRSSLATRQELGQTLVGFQQTLLTQQGDVARTQNEQIDRFGLQLAATRDGLAESLRVAALTQAQQASSARDTLDHTLARLSEQQAVTLQRFSDTLNEQLRALARSNDERMSEVRSSVERKLQAIQADNEKKLEQIRATVDEKLHATLEQRLGDSFKQVADRLDQVHRGLGEMQTLARDVGSLNRVLTNVKTRGIFGEVQLSGLLEQVLTHEQYATNVETVPGSGARVEFAIRLPGRRDDHAPLWLPIDCKFPRDDYERLVEAQERADRPAMELAARAIETRLRNEARTIRDKYIESPHTTDFGIMFVPTEGLYAEALRRPGLVESLQREYKVMLTGPTTLLATLSSLQMGFRTLALEKRSTEVWETLGAVKTEFAKFGDVLAKTKKKLDEASSSIEMAERRTRVMARSLRDVEAVPDDRAQTLLPGGLFDDEPALPR
ncbi:DNA recombination protein RmuC [Piscinibacter koreensis]|uniref:DNA recombination protein RmuC n=1 Tax=Piscinibacter koreensis TaxID=2742824 RepID=A0A7Y6NL28_9BURK|nr:DNA recombination protein RmuC [Schlegelella koreensis]NUZ05069.1 DNA recombination protein RmuC [Schlegelella koreensis]